MTNYFFDTRVGERLVSDEVGSELDGIGAAREQAVRDLTALAAFVFKSPGVESISVEVSDGSRKPVLRAVMSMSIEGFN